MSAPAVAKPAPKVIHAKAEEYLDELGECPERVEPDPATEPENAREQVEPPVDDGGEQFDDSRRTWGTVVTIGGGVLLVSAAGSYLWAESLRTEVREATRLENGVVVGMSQSEAQSNKDTAERSESAAASPAGISSA
jgi:hypothetical protein